MKPLGYATVQRETVGGRELERAVLERVTVRLRTVDVDASEGVALLHEALRLNRNVWMTFAADLASADNQLPDDIKASMLSIASFVERNTFAAASDDDARQALIDINTSIMEGLSSQAAAAG